VQVPRCFYPEVPQEGSLRQSSATFGRSVSPVGRTTGEPDFGRTSSCRPSAHDDLDTAQVCGVESGGYIKGKSAIHLARVYGERKQNCTGQSFWARGYFVSTVGRDETTIREYIRNQEKEDQRLDQMNMWQ
jgi:putative transposase